MITYTTSVLAITFVMALVALILASMNFNTDANVNKIHRINSKNDTNAGNRVQLPAQNITLSSSDPVALHVKGDNINNKNVLITVNGRVSFERPITNTEGLLFIILHIFDETFSVPMDIVLIQEHEELSKFHVNTIVNSSIIRREDVRCSYKANVPITGVHLNDVEVKFQYL